MHRATISLKAMAFHLAVLPPTHATEPLPEPEQSAKRSNEITAIPQPLEQLAFSGCIMTIDAMGTQNQIADDRARRRLCPGLTNDNHANLCDEVKATFALAEKEGFINPAWEWVRQAEKGRGCLEIREHWTLSAPEILSYLDPEHQ